MRKRLLLATVGLLAVPGLGLGLSGLRCSSETSLAAIDGDNRQVNLRSDQAAPAPNMDITINSADHNVSLRGEGDLERPRGAVGDPFEMVQWLPLGSFRPDYWDEINERSTPLDLEAMQDVTVTSRRAAHERLFRYTAMPLSHYPRIAYESTNFYYFSKGVDDFSVGASVSKKTGEIRLWSNITTRED